jgi:hypothetical protein
MTEQKKSVPVGRPITDLDAMWRMALNLSQSTLLPEAIRGNPANVFLQLCWGAELGIGPAQSMAYIYISKGGRPALSSELWLAKVLQAGHHVTYPEISDKVATVRIKRWDTGAEGDFTFTLEDAQRAKLVHIADDGRVVANSQNGKPMPWGLYTPDLLKWKAVARACRSMAPDAAMGFMTEEELALDVPEENVKAEQVEAIEAEEITSEQVRDQVKEIEAASVVSAEDLLAVELSAEEILESEAVE